RLLGVSERRAAELGFTPAPTPAAGPTARGGASGGTVIDGINGRGPFFFNPKQQENVVHHLPNLFHPPLVSANAKTPQPFIKSNNVPNDTEWAFPFELQLTLKKPVKMP